MLDNVPLRNREISSSVLSVSYHGRPSFNGTQHHSLTSQDDGHLAIFSEQEHLTDKSLISILKSDKAGLHIRDCQGNWVIVDGDLGPQEAVLYPGLALYQATAGYNAPAIQRIETSNPRWNICG
ncbi:hypothetical protein Ancab_023351 [Ancistrocladus abbreviatus]